MLIHRLSFFALAVSVPAIVFPWGNPGHRIICKIMEERLTPGGQQLVAEALGFQTSILDPFRECDEACQQDHPDDGRTLSIAEGCIWADESRRDTFKGTYEYHFINVPKAEAEFDFGRDCAALDCALVAIQRYATYLADPIAGSSRLRERKALALRFLGHFVADMHQPLHVGFIEDLGGNRIDVRFFGSATNLHTVWDSRISGRAGLTTTGDGIELNNEVTAAEATAWENFEPAAWAAESYELARTVAYVDESGEFLEDGAELATEYFNRTLPLVRQRLKQAGVRLAHLINSAAAGTLPRNMIQP